MSSTRKSRNPRARDEDEALIIKELAELSLVQTPRELFEKKRKCVGVEFFEYINESLGIILLGMQQPKVDVESCIHMIVQYNVQVYITFNESMRHYALQFEEEKETFKRECTLGNCEFYSIPIPDYTPPTIQQLHTLWIILDRFHLNRAEGNNVNLLMHCTGGTGRTATMIMSYIWYKVYMMMREPTRLLYRQIMDLERDQMHGKISKDFILLTVMQNDIIQFLMNEIEKYTPEAKKEVFLDTIPLEALHMYVEDRRELSEMKSHFNKEQQANYRDLFLTRIKTIIDACISLIDGINNPILVRLPGGIITSSRDISRESLKKKVDQKLSPKLRVIKSSDRRPVSARFFDWF